MPLYLVTDKTVPAGSPGAERLVTAARPASALRFVTEDRFAVSTPFGIDLHRLGKLGVDIEDADGEAEPVSDAEAIIKAPHFVTDQGEGPLIPDGWSVEQVAETDDLPPLSQMTAEDPVADDADAEMDPDRQREDRDERSFIDQQDELAEDEKPF